MIWTALKGLFASNADDIVSGVSSGIDKAFFTNEEKADANKKVLDWKLKWLEATRPQNVSRRFIAVTVTSLWAGIVVTMLVAEAAGKEDFAEYAFQVMKDVVATPFAIIIGFYFAAHVARGLLAKE